MNWELYKKYGEYNFEGYYIENHDIWDRYANDIKLYKRNKLKAFLFYIIPMIGGLIVEERFNQMGISTILRKSIKSKGVPKMKNPPAPPKRKYKTINGKEVLQIEENTKKDKELNDIINAYRLSGKSHSDFLKSQL